MLGTNNYSNKKNNIVKKHITMLYNHKNTKIKYNYIDDKPVKMLIYRTNLLNNSYIKNNTYKNHTILYTHCVIKDHIKDSNILLQRNKLLNENYFKYHNNLNQDCINQINSTQYNCKNDDANNIDILLQRTYLLNDEHMQNNFQYNFNKKNHKDLNKLAIKCFNFIYKKILTLSNKKNDEENKQLILNIFTECIFKYLTY
ncbi:MAG: hypothetical protein AAFO15_01125 [Pseudomonadota bacterium]